MPRDIEAGAMPAIELGDLVERLSQPDFDPTDEDCFASFGPWLAALARNRTFLGTIAVAELKDRLSGQRATNRYSAQVVMLQPPTGRFFIRANFWPGNDDAVMRDSGPSAFLYGVPHDHNFSFLTVGYVGPGYWSDYYEYDHEQAVGRVGEKIDLRAVGRSRLAEGRVMLYRAHRDVHNQWPADAFSVSLNVMEVSERQGWTDQYRFDVDKGEISGILNAAPATALLALAAHLGGNGRDLLDHVATTHPVCRTRLAAIEATATIEGAQSWARWSGDPSRLVRETARLRLGETAPKRSMSNL